MNKNSDNIEGYFYWSEIPENDLEVNTSFTDWQTNRRSFLKLTGSGISSMALLSACRNKLTQQFLPKSKDDEISQPGNINWFSTSCDICSQHCSVLVKTFENRPIKIEINQTQNFLNTGICPEAQASLYELYHSERLNQISINGKLSSAGDALKHFSSIIDDIKKTGREIFLFSPVIHSPSKAFLIDRIKNNLPAFHHHLFDPAFNFSYVNCLNKNFKKALIPVHDYSDVKIIVGFNTRFLENPAELQSFLRTRNIESTYDSSFFLQFENDFSQSGAYADKRYPASISQQKMIMTSLIQQLSFLKENKSEELDENINKHYPVKSLAQKLHQYYGRSLFLSDIQDDAIQELVFKLNVLCGNFNRSIKTFETKYNLLSGEFDLKSAFNQIKNSNNPLIILMDVDESIFSIAKNSFEKSLPAEYSLIVSAMFPHKMHQNAEIIWPSSHFTEKWGDYLTSSANIGICQAIIEPLTESIQPENLLLTLAGFTGSYYEYFKDFCKEHYFTNSENADFDNYWNNALRMGYFENNQAVFFRTENLITSFNLKPTNYQIPDKPELYLIKSSKSKNYKYNPLLQELPSAVSKVCWTNCGFISPLFAEKHKIKDGEIVEIVTKYKSFKIALALLPGIADNVVVVDYDFQDAEGNNISAVSELHHNCLNKHLPIIKISNSGHKTKIIRSQAGISKAEKSFLPVFEKNEFLSYERKEQELNSLQKRKSKYTPQWAMVIDLNKCTACGSCVIGCQTENNTVVIGPDEMSQNRGMHWIRIDRYFAGSENETEAFFIPVLCQHCENAPCEAVCPVGASSHSAEGLNQQNYKRCIGARFCNANCTYLVRKFNFKNYAANNYYKVGNIPLMLNPEVSMREKGITEKCTFCIQRIQQKKREAKINNKVLTDNEIKTACQQSCPAQAIYFGNISDPGSKVFRLANSKRAFRLLEHKGTKSQIYYLSKVKNNKFLES